MRIGNDITYIPRFEKLMENRQFIENVFHATECREYNPEHLAGIFAAKEAFFKAIDRKPDWLKVEIRKQKTGRPMIITSIEGIEPLDVSISHDKDYALATVLVKESRGR
ncbi:MAG: 4'-phosphopantetheinyl transferase superfamily protein [Candidatus Woesearchaeota archaeon]